MRFAKWPTDIRRNGTTLGISVRRSRRIQAAAVTRPAANFPSGRCLHVCESCRWIGAGVWSILLTFRIFFALIAKSVER